MLVNRRTKIINDSLLHSKTVIVLRVLEKLAVFSPQEKFTTLLGQDQVKNVINALGMCSETLTPVIHRLVLSISD